MLKIKKNKTIVFLVVLGLLIFLHIIGLLSPLENGLNRLLDPIASRIYSKGNSFNFSYKENKEKGQLLTKINKLNKELEQVTAEKAKWQEIDNENQKLKKILKFTEKNKFNKILSKIVAKESFLGANNEEENIIINQGSQAGVKVGNVIVSEQGSVIGKIIASKKNSSEACLIINQGCRLAATIQNNDHTIGLTDGDLGLTIKMNYIPQSEKINKGDLVTTSGLEKDIPRGLLIGKVNSVNSESNEVWQSAVIDPIVNFNNLIVVIIIS